jgi:hypothetical protein
MPLLDATLKLLKRETLYKVVVSFVWLGKITKEVICY